MAGIGYALVARIVVFLVFLNAGSIPASAQQEVLRIPDIIYDRRDGMAFLFDIIKPEKQNGAAILYVVSGGWVSREASAITTNAYKRYTDKGYTLFIISHGSQPRYTVKEIIGQIQRAIKFIRYNAPVYGVDPARFGIMGHSAGGHLSVSAAVFGRDAMSEEEYRRIYSVSPEEKIDSVNLTSSKVQAVGCFYPPTNFINYISADSNWFDFPKVRNVSANGSFIATPDSPKDFQTQSLRALSPYFFASKLTPPVLIIHGTDDDLVPFSQSVSFVAKLEAYQVPCRLIRKQGKGHGWPGEKADEDALLHWFDRHLLY